MNAFSVLCVAVSLLSVMIPGMATSADPPAAEPQKVVLDDQGLVPAAAAGHLRQLQGGLRAPAR